MKRVKAIFDNSIVTTLRKCSIEGNIILYNLVFLGIWSSLFVNFMVQILSHGSNSVHNVTSFKILNDVAICILLNVYYLIYTIKWIIFVSFQTEWILFPFVTFVLYFLKSNFGLLTSMIKWSFIFGPFSKINVENMNQ